MSVNARFTATGTLKKVQLLTCQPSLCLSNVLSLTVESRPGKMDRLEFGQKPDLALRGHEGT